MAAVGVCLVAFGLATYDLEFRSMWYDEWLSWNWSQMNPIAMTIDTAKQGGHPPTYYAFLWAWTRLTMTEQISAMRLSSTLFGVLTVALTYRLTLAWFDNHRVALIAALVTAISSMMVYFMRELRMYTLMTLLVTLSWWAFWRFMSGKRSGALLYGLTLALMAYTYYFTAFMAFVQFVMALVFFRKRLLRLFAVYVGVLLVLSPWIPSLVMQIQNDAQYLEEGEGLELPIIGLVGKGAASQASDADSIRSFINRYTNGQPYVIFGLAALGAIVGAAHFWKDQQKRLWYIAALLWFAGTTLIFFGGNFITPIYNPRYLLMIVPGLGMVVAFAFVELPSRYQWLMGGGLVIFGLLTHTAGFFGLREPHNDLLGTVSAQFEEGDRVWYNLSGGAQGSSLFSAPEYYLDVKYTNLTEDDFIWDASDDFESVEEVPRVWDVRDIYTQIPDEIHGEMLNGRRVTQQHQFGEYTVRLYEVPPQQEPALFSDIFAVTAEETQNTVTRGETVTVTMWSDVLQAPQIDYSLALHLRTTSGEVVTQADVPLVFKNPFNEDEQTPTSGWQLENAPYLVQEMLAIPNNLPRGDYALWATVYHWQNAPDGLPLDAPEIYTTAGNFIQVGTVTVK